MPSIPKTKANKQTTARNPKLKPVTANWSICSWLERCGPKSLSIWEGGCSRGWGPVGLILGRPSLGPQGRPVWPRVLQRSVAVSPVTSTGADVGPTPLLCPQAGPNWPESEHDLPKCMLAHLLQLCLALRDSVVCSPAGPSAHENGQARTLEWVAASSSRGSPQPRDLTAGLVAPTL